MSRGNAWSAHSPAHILSICDSLLLLGKDRLDTIVHMQCLHSVVVENHPPSQLGLGLKQGSHLLLIPDDLVFIEVYFLSIY